MTLTWKGITSILYIILLVFNALNLSNYEISLLFIHLVQRSEFFSIDFSPILRRAWNCMKDFLDENDSRCVQHIFLQFSMTSLPWPTLQPYPFIIRLIRSTELEQPFLKFNFSWFANSVEKLCHTFHWYFRRHLSAPRISFHLELWNDRASTYINGLTYLET